MTDTLFTSTATAFGGLEGKVQSSDGVINLEMVLPGSPESEERKNATNAEQLFAAAYASCFSSALQMVADREQINFQSEVTANVSLLKDETGEGYKLAVDLQVKGDSIEKSQLEHLVQKANQLWPYADEKKRTMNFTLTVH